MIQIVIIPALKSLSCVTAFPPRGDSAFGSQTCSSGFRGAAAGGWTFSAEFGSSRSRGLLVPLPSLSLLDSWASVSSVPFAFPSSSLFSLSLSRCPCVSVPRLSFCLFSLHTPFIPEYLSSPALSGSLSSLSITNLLFSIREMKAKHRELVCPALAIGRGDDVTRCHSACLGDGLPVGQRGSWASAGSGSCFSHPMSPTAPL